MKEALKETEHRPEPNPVIQRNKDVLPVLSGQNRRHSRRAVDHIRALVHASIESLAYIGYAVIIVDSWGRVEYLTGTARSLLQSCEELISLSKNLLTFMHKEHACHFGRILAWVKHPQPAEGIPSCTFLVKRVPPHRPIAVSVFPLMPIVQENSSPGHVIVTLCDPDHQTEFRWHVFSKHYGLTVAELRLCRGLASGLSIREYSQQYSVSLNTTRTQLKSIFAKTAARRQTALLLLILAFLHS